MEINEVVAIVKSVADSIGGIKAACDAIPVGWFKPTKNKLNELQTQIIELEGIVYSGFPKLKQLIILYSDITTKVGIARALSEKIAEIITLSPQLSPDYVIGLLSPTETELTGIIKKINELPALESSEAGALKEKLDRIKTLIRDIQMLVDRGGTQAVEVNKKEIAANFREISRNYSGIETKLSELLNNRILKSFDF